MRTRHGSPQTNGVIERLYESIKYEHLYREEIPSGQALIEEIDRYVALYNEVRPHEHLGFETPIRAYLRPPEPNLFLADPVQEP